MKIKLLDNATCDAAKEYMFDLLNRNLLENEKKHRFGPDNDKSYKLYSDVFFRDIALKTQPQLEEAYGFKLYPTYTFTRLYKEGFILRPHVDRPACEYSSTITIAYGDRDHPWEFYVEENNETKEYILESGEGVLYSGRELPHWRFPLDKGWQIQTFVHYIKMHGDVYDILKYDYPDFPFHKPFQDFIIDDKGMSHLKQN